MWPCAQVCQRTPVKATAASVAIKAATAGRFVLDASEPGGGVADCGVSGMAEPATRAWAAGCS